MVDVAFSGGFVELIGSTSYEDGGSSSLSLMAPWHLYTSSKYLSPQQPYIGAVVVYTGMIPLTLASSLPCR